MNAPIIAASFILGTLNPKFGAALQNKSSDRPASADKTIAAGAPAAESGQTASSEKKTAEDRQKTAARDGKPAGADAKQKARRGGQPKQTSTASKAAQTAGGLSRKARRLDPDRQGFAALFPASAKVMTVRVTVYWKNGTGTDHYTSKGIAATGARLVNKRSAAVDPALIPFGSRIILPEAGKELIAVDTGSAVKNRTAARKLGKDVPVVDIYFECKKEALDFASSHPLFMKAFVLN